MIKKIKKIKENEVLTKEQKDFLLAFSSSVLARVFRLTGGTALSAFYLQHRYSYDLDFFSEEEVSLYEIERFLKNLNFCKEISFFKSFERKIFKLNLKDGKDINLEFIYYPLKNFKNPIEIEGILIDDFFDIAINKLCAIADRNEIKDYVDFYFALKSSKISLKRFLDFADKKCQIKGLKEILKYKLLQIPKGVENLFLIKKVKKEEMENYFSSQIKMIIEKELENIK